MDKKQICVLLLEDEAAHAEAIRRALESADSPLEVHIVTTLKEFRDYVAANTPDIALIDMVLPDGNGIDLLSSTSESNTFPMLILTSHGNEMAAVEALKSGAMDYVVKSPEIFADMPRILTRNLNQWTLIREKKEAEKALQVSEQNFSNSMENSPLGIHIISEDGETSYTNRAFLDIYGYKDVAEFNNTPVKDRYTPRSYTEFHERREKRLRHEPLPDTYEVHIVRKDGTVRQLQVIRKEIPWAGKPQYQTIYQDITEHRHAEEALKQSEEKFRLLTENASFGVYIIQDGKMVYVNQTFAKFFGYEPNEIIDILSPKDLIHPDDIQAVMRRLRERMEGKKEERPIKYRGIRKDGTLIYIEVFGNSIDFRGKTAVMGTLADVTERERAQEALQESEARYHELVDTITSGVIIYRVVDNGEDFVFVDVNHAAEKLEGINRKDVIGKKVTEVLPGSRGYSWFPIFRRVWQTGNSEYFSSNWRKDESDPGRWRDNCAYKLPGGEIVNVYDDITDKKLAEEAVKASEQNFRNSMDSSSMGIRIMGDAGYTLYANQALLDMFGYENIEELRASPLQEHYTPESCAGFIRRKERFALGEPLPGTLEVDIIHKDGGIRHIQLSSKHVLWNGKPQFQILYNDITERVRAEEALQAAEQNFRNSINTSPMAIRIRELNGQTLYANKAFMELFYYKTIEEVPTNPLLDHYTPAEKARYLMRQEKRSLGETITGDFEVDITAKDGTIRHLQVYLNEVIWNGKQGFQIIYNDITETKNAQEALQSSEQNFRNSLENSPVGIRISDRNDDTLYTNQAFLDIFGYANIEELKASPPLKHYTPEAYTGFLQRMEKQRSGKSSPDSVDIDIVRKDGNIRHLRLFTRELVWYGQQQFQNLYTDITERKEARMR